MNDLDKTEITEEMLNHLAVEDALAEDFYQLSLNALSSAETDNSMKLKTMVKDKVMLVLLDSRSSHSFISSDFVKLAKLPTVPIPSRKVKLANGEYLTTTQKVQKLRWYIQGHTLCSDMIGLDMGPYDAIIGYDWLKENSPMQFDWNKKTIQFTLDGKLIKLQGLLAQPLQTTPISAKKVYNAAIGNDTWTYVILAPSPTPVDPPLREETATPPSVQQILDRYKDVFQDPKTLPPPRSYDHSIPLLPGAVPVNARPYHYSPQHKIEIEAQVKQLLQQGLITHSHNPFASPVLLVKKKDGT